MKITNKIEFFMSPEIHKEKNIFWILAIPKYNILISGGADGHLIVWTLNSLHQLNNGNILYPVIIFESQKYEEDDRSAEDVLDISVYDNYVAIGTRFGSVSLFGVGGRNITSYKRTPTEQEFLENTETIYNTYFKILVDRNNDMIKFVKEENREKGFFQFDIVYKHDKIYKVLK